MVAHNDLSCENHIYSGVRLDVQNWRNMSARKNQVAVKMVSFPVLAVDTALSACMDTLFCPVDLLVMALDSGAKTNQSVETQN
jgi:uncharacterized protein YceK